MFVQIPPDHQDLIPHRATFDILSAMQYNNAERTLKDIIDDIESGAKQIWIEFDDETNEHLCTVVTSIQEFPRKLTCIIEYMGGVRVQDWDQLKQIEDWAKFNGCADLQIIGRKGWKRKMASFGFTERYTILGKPL